MILFRASSDCFQFCLVFWHLICRNLLLFVFYYRFPYFLDLYLCLYCASCVCHLLLKELLIDWLMDGWMDGSIDRLLSLKLLRWMIWPSLDELTWLGVTAYEKDWVIKKRVAECAVNKHSAITADTKTCCTGISCVNICHTLCTIFAWGTAVRYWTCDWQVTGLISSLSSFT